MKIFEVALEVHPWSVPYGLVMVRRLSFSNSIGLEGPRHHFLCNDRKTRDKAIMGTTPPPSLLFTVLLFPIAMRFIVTSFRFKKVFVSTL